MIGAVSFITIDANDPERLASFWGEVLGTDVEDRVDGGRFVFLARANGTRLCFQRVPEAKAGKNRVHVDVEVDDLDAATDRIVALGATWDGFDRAIDDDRWRTLQDPEGNEFDIFAAAG
ncbi:MAG TPA: VOC family protein [Actinomycetota bacterium]|nr:VOC family protein [Actinomycetota bacterium]